MDETGTGGQENNPQHGDVEPNPDNLEAVGADTGNLESGPAAVSEIPGEMEPEAGSSPEYNSSEISQLKLCGVGFTILYIAMGIFAVAFIALAAIMYLGQQNAINIDSIKGISVLISGAIIIASWLTVLGTGFFMPTPRRSGGQVLLQVSFLIVLGGILANLFSEATRLVPTATVLPQFGTLLAAYIISQTIAAFLFYLGITRLMEFAGKARNAVRAQSLVVWSPMFYLALLGVLYSPSFLEKIEVFKWIARFGFIIIGLIVLFKYIRLLSDGKIAIKEAVS